jgi:PKD repeat protein
LKRAYAAYIGILEEVDRLPEGFLRYDNLDKTRPNTPPKVRIAVLSDTVRVGDKVWAANNDMFFSDDKACYRYPGIPDWASLKFDWGDGTITVGEGTPSTHVYKKPGDYTITMTLTDTEDAVASDTHKIKVLNAPS